MRTIKILLADDDPGVIQALLPVLKAIPGATVRPAVTGEKALENAEAMGGPDVLVTDVVMEPIDGFTLRDRIVAKYPRLRTVFITGYDLSEYQELTAGHTVLQKPVANDALRAAVEKAAAVPESSAPSAPELTQALATPAATPAGAPGASSDSDPDAAPQTLPTIDDPAVGSTIGTFHIVRKLGDGIWGGVYEAVQTNMGRPVAINVLAPQLSQDPDAKKRFIAGASAKANVQHPLILSVYEAGEADGRYYFTHEYVDGMNLEEMASQGQTIDEPKALQVVKTVTEAMAYLHQNKIAHAALEARHIYLASDGQPRVANLASWEEASQSPLQVEIAILAQAVRSVLPDGKASDPELAAMLAKMETAGQGGYLSWVSLMQTVKSLERTVVPADAFKLSQQDVAAIRAVEETRKRQRRSLILNIVGMTMLILTVGSLVYWKFIRTGRAEDVMVRIPEGPFVYQDGETRTLKDFWIDRYEVTIGQYSDFLEYLERNPTTRFDHPNQPAGHRHEPEHWEIYYERAKAEQPVRGFQTISLDTPVMVVDWWDAYAYAKWKGRRLPTEEEWEKAARGPKGTLYPWGNTFDATKVNSAKDHQPKVPTARGSVDGWNYWAPVDAIKGDKSGYGVVGMAGNVQEWTASWDEKGKFPIVRGGSYESASNKATDRITNVPDTTRAEHIGFRTASSEKPNH